MRCAADHTHNPRMQTSNVTTHPLPRITFRSADRSAALEERARELAARLGRFHDRITGCRIVVEGPSLHHATGGTFTVSFEVAIPGGVIYAISGQAPRPEHSDPYVALRDAFENARRQLKSFASC
jgi:Sigma 54 modulation protein / S30EA ribosomal protein